MITKISPLAPKTQKKTHKISGVSIASIHCGLKKNNKDDLVLIKFEEPSYILSVFTKSMLPGSPINWNKSICKKKKFQQYLLTQVMQMFSTDPKEIGWLKKLLKS